MANKEQASKKTDKKKPSDTKVKKEKKTYGWKCFDVTRDFFG